MKAETLRKKYPRFFYKGYSYERKGRDLSISFDFAVPPDILFRPSLVVKNAPREKKNIENLVFHLGLVEMISYWKATCSPQIVVEAGHLNKKQIQWWKTLILKGMGEYFYQNKIDFTKPNFLTIISSSRGKLSLTKFANLVRLSFKERVLVPVGGGKDAVVTLELLKKAKVPIRLFVLNQKPEQKRILSLAKAGKPVAVERIIDPKLFELNKKGYLNGHTPFSAYLAFLSVLTAVLFDYKYIALSNERSANEGNVKYLGRVINHQYSKTFEFEKTFRQYGKKYLAKEVEYFSFLRPLYELQIARIFAKYPKYFSAFLSCNEAHKTKSGTRKPTGKWCGKCTKCLFVFLALYPFAGRERTVRIFNRNLLKDKKLKPLLDELTGKRKFKPFECVGTIRESRAALSLALGKQKTHALLRTWNKRHFLARRFSQILTKEIRSDRLS